MNRTRHECWLDWLDHTLLADIHSDETPGPVPVFEATSDERTKSAAFDEYRYGRGSGDYLYMLYFLDEPVSGPESVQPMYIGETNTITSRLHQHYKKIRDATPIDEWIDDESWGSWSKYDHMGALTKLEDRPLYAWILDVDALDACPYGFPTYRQELEAKLVGLVHSLPRFERTFANREFVPNRVVHEMGKVGPDWLSSGHGTYEPPTLGNTARVSLAERAKTDLWHEWVDDVILADLRDEGEPDPIPLLATDDSLEVQLNENGGLMRTNEVDAMIRREGKKCVHHGGVKDDSPEGLLYVLFQLADHEDTLESTDLIPRYIGKGEAYGKKNELSANFEEIAKDRDATRSFARWGDGNYWHTGELSNTVFGDDSKKTTWASELFEQGTRTLTQQTYLWIRAWDPLEYRGPYGYDAYLAEAEPLLIGLAYDAYPNRLLNHSGVPDDAPVKTREYQFDPVRE